MFWEWLSSRYFKHRIGFTPSQLKALYIKLLNRDDGGEYAGWVIELIANTEVTFCNNIVEIDKYRVYILGRYTDATNLKISVQDFKAGMIIPTEVLDVNNWRGRNGFTPGPWQRVIKFLIREYLYTYS